MAGLRSFGFLEPKSPNVRKPTGKDARRLAAFANQCVPSRHAARPLDRTGIVTGATAMTSLTWSQSSRWTAVRFREEADGFLREVSMTAQGREMCSAISDNGRCRQSDHSQPRLAPAARSVRWSIQGARTAAVAIRWGQHRARRVRRQRKGHLDWPTHGTTSGQVMVAGGSRMLRRLTKCSCTFAWL